MKYVTVSEMQAIEQEANAKGLTYAQMMESAGRGLAEVVEEMFGDLKEDGVLGLVGSGNNGGDTLVALTHLREYGWVAAAYLVRPRPQDDPLITRFNQAGGEILRAVDDPDYDQLVALVQQNAVVLDGILGTGIRLPLKPEVGEVLAATRAEIERVQVPPFVVAVDCPSGVDADTGEAAPDSIPATITVTMGAVKQGLLKLPAFNLIGALHLVGIGLPEDGAGIEAWKKVQTFVPSAGQIKRALPDRPADAHKGTFGTVLVVAGSMNYTGAVLLVGEAAYRSGAGLVTLAAPRSLHAPLAGQIVEATWLPLDEDHGWIAASAASTVLENLERATALVVGPGFGMQATTASFLARLIGAEQEQDNGKGNRLKARRLPVVIDADGLKLLAGIPNWHTYLPPPAILTPHPGEMAILTGLPVQEIQADRVAAARRFSQQWGHVVVLKGAFTVVASPEGQAAVIPVASPALARAGTGDVLAGLIGGLRAQGVDAFWAAVSGAWIHAHAGLAAAVDFGNTASVLARDVLSAIPDLLIEIHLAGEELDL